MTGLPERADIRAALFDLDGTLVDTSIDFAEMRGAMTDLALEVGCLAEEVAERDILSIVDCACEHLVVSGRAAGAPSLRARAMAALEAIEVRDCSDPVVVPGARDLLQRMRAADVKIGIVTRNSRRVSVGLLARFDLAWDTLVAREDVERTKPHPDHLLRAMAQLGVTEVDRTLFVGDHRMDVSAGSAAGVHTVGLLRGRSHEWFRAPSEVAFVEELADLRRWWLGSCPPTAAGTLDGTPSVR